ncbi:MAG: CopG family ribbon-helix-helix protein [Blastomonas fulva]|jgi:predicted transcriptional regulator|uniref:CopG family ribbon-helix-helix protein n=1 Tax=Blastomonas TaxID=150203 RepID=UPI0024E23208|nr:MULTISPECIES: ribbon-helix-helix protein, CopG family [Blastomonas]MCO5794239.1 ribbon-helix-helix protein, CopG family [Blastomonas sp.]MDK2755672.1 ribbon-helix-helix protein, CopG family [Blastomonas fulva]MDM7930220.1 ribbon-helix-helix protein, CopG family [Blastomonas fulva]MDM7965900.1 ribbon-helix-helix protein, CopG family [Blastomonas fulva]
MSKSQVITARIDPEVMALVDRLAAAQGRSRSWLAARAIEKMARAETAFLDFVKEGEDAIARGDYLTQEQMEEWITEMKVGARAKIAAQKHERDEAA